MAQQKSSDVRKKLTAELQKLVKDINQEGLVFLIEQANVLIYNQNIEKVNKEIIKSGSNTKNSTNKVKKTGTHVEIFPDDKKNSFIIQIDTTRKFVSRADFRYMVTISQGSDPIKERCRNLYRWLSKERQDFIMDNKIKNNTDKKLELLINVISKKYKIKK